MSRDDIGTRGRTVVCPRCKAQWYVDGAGRGEDLSVDAVSRRVETPATTSASPVPPRRRVAGLRPLMAVVACIAALMLVIGARDHIVRLVPRMARAYALAGLPVNVRGLEFADVAPVRSPTLSSELTISGRIRNVTDRRIRMPRLAYEIRDAGGAPLLTWSEAAPVTRLAAGDVLAFASRPHGIPDGAVSVLVHFQSDAAATRATHLARLDDK